MNRFFVIFIFLEIFSTSLWGQSKIEKLRTRIDTTENDSIKVKLYRSLGNRYSNLDYDSAMSYFMKSIKLSQQLKWSEEEANTLRYIGITQKNIGNIDSALVCYSKSLKLHLDNGNIKEAAYVHNNIGIVYKNLADYDKAIEEYVAALKIFDSLNLDRGRALVYNNIGIVHKNQKKYDEAIRYYYKALEINKKLKQPDPLASNLNNIASMLVRKNLLDSAMECFQQAKKLREDNNNEIGIADSYSLIASLYIRKHQWEKGIGYIQKALPILEKNKSVYSQIHAYISMSRAYYNLEINKLGSSTDLKKAERYLLKSIKLSKEINYLIGQKIAYELLADIYSEENRDKEALDSYRFFVLLNDSLFNLERSKQMANIETKYESEKKQLEIDKLQTQQELDKEKIIRQNIENKKQRIINYIILLGSIILLFFIFYVLKSLKQKKRANLLLSQQKTEISEQNEELNQYVEEITTQKEEIESQRDKVATQNEQLERINTDVSNSIEYAKKIQRSILSNTNILNDYLSGSFVFFKPRDVVSGDFYWWAKVEEQLVITAADCTGHGVPGAFMSMLGVSFLREIVMKEYITHPGVILRKLRKEIINSLRQKEIQSNGNLSSNRDGMDMSMVSLNIKTKVLQFAGANNPIYIIRKEKLDIESDALKLFEESKSLDRKLYELKPDKMPISIYDRMDRFKTHEIQLSEGDQIYMFSDGFADQFGGVKEKKLKYKPFKNLLLEVSDLPMEEQREQLYQFFMEWKSNLEQIDDVLVLGIRI